MKTIELAIEGDHPALMPGIAYRLKPVLGEGGTIVAYRVVGDDNAVVMTLPASAVKAVERYGEAEGGGGDAEIGLTDEEEIELLRALGYDI